ncbi:MAG: hypothetical protein P4L50_10860, partial [Anaerolineaceae bacterium]|nr:hypothetical protein [Anaerolineaceae bacterium]
MIKVELHDGTAYQTQASMGYNGLGQRLSESGAGQTTSYLVNQTGDSSPLAAYGGGQASYYLYGYGALGEFNSDWNYYLPDGVNTVRQVSVASGAIILARSYTPWGEVLSQNGNASALRGYMGSLWDPTTSLIYAERTGANAPAAASITTQPRGASWLART